MDRESTRWNEGFLGFIGAELLSDDPDDARARVAVADHLKQPFGLVHGGVYSTLVEGLCSNLTAVAVLGEGLVPSGQSQATSFLRPISEGHVNVTARARHRGRTSWIWDAEVSDDEGRLCALSRMTVAVRPARD
jgi:uncharacterized protein (TIGR00369 family)